MKSTIFYLKLIIVITIISAIIKCSSGDSIESMVGRFEKKKLPKKADTKVEYDKKDKKNLKETALKDFKQLEKNYKEGIITEKDILSSTAINSEREKKDNKKIPVKKKLTERKDEDYSVEMIDTSTKGKKKYMELKLKEYKKEYTNKEKSLNDLIKAALADKDLRNIILKKKYKELYKNEEYKELIKSPEIREYLKSEDFNELFKKLMKFKEDNK